MKEEKVITAKLIVLAIHNILRWVIVISALYALIRIFKGLLQKQSWQAADSKAVTFFSIFLDIQLLVGMLLYFVFSDLTKAAFADFGAAMGNSILRFFTIEHTLMMVIAIVLAHLSAAVGKKDLSDDKKFKRAAIFITLAFLFLLAGIPWSTRPLLPAF
jgi:hypothetical protein